MVGLEGWIIPGVVTKLSPFRVHINMSDCKEAVKPDDLTVEIEAEVGLC